MTAMPEITVPEYVTEDGGKRTRGIDYPFVSNSTQAGQLAALMIANTREGIAGVIPLKPHLQRIRPGDAFTITEPGFVLSGLKCLCLNTEYDPNTGVVRVSFVSETDGKYAYAMGLSPTPPEPQVLTPNDYSVTPPTTDEWSFASETLTEGDAATPALVFTGAVDSPMAEQVIFEYRVVDTPEREWAGAGVEDPKVTRKEVTSVTSGTVYEGAVTYRIGNRYSERLILGPVTAGVFVPPFDPGMATALRSSIEVESNLQSSGTTWITWGQPSFDALPTGGTIKPYVDLTADLGMTLTSGTIFNGEWRITQAGTTIRDGQFRAIVDGSDPVIEIFVSDKPFIPVETGPTSLSFQIRRFSGANDIASTGANLEFYADWIKTG